MSHSETTHNLDVDVVVFGGGIAGLWLHASLRKAGYQSLLIEKQSLGVGQTRFAQGIIHGGTKYALTGKLTASSEAVFAMPKIWRDCLAGKGQHDLSSVITLSPFQYMWSTPGLFSRLSGFFASRVMRGKTQPLTKSQRPAIFQHKAFKGKVYQLDEPVLDTASVIHALAAPNLDSIMHVDSEVKFNSEKENQLRLHSTDGQSWQISYQKIVLTAGKGNQQLLTAMGYDKPEMQLRPLHMVMLKGGLPEKLYAHCLGASVNPRMTITSHTDNKGEIVWYLGGQLAEEGVQRSEQQQIQQAKKELRSLIPWLDHAAMQWQTRRVDRAEPVQEGGKRPDTSFFVEQDNVITAWPTKLALSPKLSSDILQHIKNHKVVASGITALPGFAHPDIATLPWQEDKQWQ